jgi:hypothetical protein
MINLSHYTREIPHYDYLFARFAPESSISSMNDVVFRDETFLSGLSGTGSTPDAVFFSPSYYPFPQDIPYTLSISQIWYTEAGGTFTRTLTVLKCGKSGQPKVHEHSWK